MIWLAPDGTANLAVVGLPARLAGSDLPPTLGSQVALPKNAIEPAPAVGW
jgi:hypothetical protein